MLGSIYIIQSPYTDKVYIGSTFMTLEKRFGFHKKRGNKNTSKIIIEEGEATIELLEEVKVIDKKELEFYEQQYLELYRDIAVNERSAFGIDTKKRQEKGKEYREKNKDKIVEYAKKHSIEKKEEISEYHAKYYEKNRDKVIEKSKKYVEKNKEKVKEYQKKYKDKRKSISISCPCGGSYTSDNRNRHLKTQKHKNYVAQE
jgi:hypothetical protein